METTRTYRMYDWIGRHVGSVTTIALVFALAIAVSGSFVANTDEPNFDPAGEVFDTATRAEITLNSDSAVASATFLVEAPGGNMLSPAAMRELFAAQSRIRNDATNEGILVERFDLDTGVVTAGVFSIVDIIDQELPAGINNASDDQLNAAVAAILSPGSQFKELRFSLSEATTSTTGANGTATWIAPALLAEVTYDEAALSTEGATELWLRDVQSEFRTDAVDTYTFGVAIDGDTTFEEAAAGSAPFILLAVALIVGLVAVVHRSYWSAVVAAAGLGATSLAYYGTSALIGLKMGSVLLGFIVPIAMIGFGIDFFIHGVGRVREMQVRGLTSDRAYPAGMQAVIRALTLAVATSVAAFLSNAASGIEAITQFGIGAAVSLAWAYLLLGQLAPLVVLRLEHFVGLNPVKRLAAPFYFVLVTTAAVFGGLTVALTAVMPLVGAAALALFLVLAIALPAAVTRGRNHRGAIAGKQLHPAFRGVGHGLESAGSLTWFVARWRKITLPIVILAGIVAIATASTVESGFKVTDFLSSDTDFVQSIERTNEHFPSAGEGSSYIFVEGDLTNPTALEALDAAVADLGSSQAQFGRNSAGDLLVERHAGDYVRMTMESAQAVAAIETQGVTLTDRDSNRIPDTAAGVRAVFDYIAANGVPTPDGGVAVTQQNVPATLFDDGANSQATAIVVQVGSFTDRDIITPVQDALNDQANALEQTPGITASVSGDVIAEFESMNSFTKSMLTALPLAILITLLIATAILRSFRFALVSVIPIGFVVSGIYAFMAVAGYTVNVVTATIAAIAVGIGVDFSAHFTARFREELDLVGDPLEAVRRAGAGTGGALVLSAITSVLGFAVMATAPTPVFATFGMLTAVMITLALAATLLILPSLLVMAAPQVAPSAGSPSRGREEVLSR